MAAKILAGLVALLMGITAVGWLTDPASAAEGLGMPLLDGIGRSTQVGDFSAFFVGVTSFCVLGILRNQPIWLLSAAIILGLAAVMRTLAWLVHGADFATAPIVVEVVTTVMLVGAAYLMRRAGDSGAAINWKDNVASGK